MSDTATVKNTFRSRLVFRFARGSRTLNNLKVDAHSDDIKDAYNALRVLFNDIPIGCEVTDNSRILTL